MNDTKKSSPPAANDSSANAPAWPGLLASLKQVKAYDEQRPSFPGEHWLVLGTGLAILLMAQRSDSAFLRTAGGALGSAMLYRAASGRDGLAKLLPYLPSALKAGSR